MKKESAEMLNVYVATLVYARDDDTHYPGITTEHFDFVADDIDDAYEKATAIAEMHYEDPDDLQVRYETRVTMERALRMGYVPKEARA